MYGVGHEAPGFNCVSKLTSFPLGPELSLRAWWLEVTMASTIRSTA